MKGFPLFATGINDTSGIGGKFATGVVDTGDDLPPVSNLPLVSLIPVVHLDLQISPLIFEKF